MRAAPIGGFFWDDYIRVVENAAASAEPTHAHAEGKAGAIAVALAAAAAARVGIGQDERSDEVLFDAVLAHCPKGETRRGIENAARIPLTTTTTAAAQQLGNGSRVIAQDTVPFCVWSAAKHLDRYEEAMWGTVAALGDRDTTCAIVGGIVATCVGLEGIPPEFIRAREPLPGNADEW
jgi:ADP-ribosylglycohydrolase